MKSFAFLPLAAVLAAACGQVVVTSERPPTDEPPTDKPDPTPQDVALACSPGAAKDPGRPVLAWQRGWDVLITRADGSTEVAYTFALAAEAPEEVPVMDLAARGGRVAATAFHATEGAVRGEAVLLTIEGDVVWSSGPLDVSFWPPMLGEDGGLTLLPVPYDTIMLSTMVVSPKGESKTLDGLLAIAGPSAEGVFPADLTPEAFQNHFGWYHPETGTEPFDYAMYNGAYPGMTDDGVLYVAFAAPGTKSLVLVVETFEETAAIDLPVIDATAIATSRSGWAVVQTSSAWETPHFLARPKSGEIHAIALPEDLYPFGLGQYGGPALDDGGALLIVGRNASTGGLFRSTDLGQSWQRVGKSVAGVADILFTQRGDTIVVQPTDQQGFFPVDEWQSPGEGEAAPEHVGSGVEVVRPGAGIAWTLDPGATGFTLSEDGSCVGYVENGRFRAMHVASGEVIDLSEVDLAVTGLPRGAWIP